MIDHSRRSGRKYFLEYGLLAAATIIAAYFILHLQNFDLFIPNAYFGDGWAYLSVIKGLIEQGVFGWVLHVDRLGAPTGAMMYDSMVYQQAGLHNFMMKLLGLMVPDENFVLNVYYLLSYPLITMATYLCMREAQLRRPYAVLGAFLVAFTSYHLSRNTVHIYLSAYYMMPLACTVFVWLLQERLNWQPQQSWKNLWRNPRFVASAVIVFLLAVSDAYYTFFLLLLFALQMASIFFSGKPDRWRQLAVVFTLIGVIGIGGMTLVLPTLPEKWAHPNPETNIYPLKRHYYMADYNSLRLDTMLLPSPNYRIPAIQSFIIDYQKWLQVHGETVSASIGTLPAVGFLLGVAFMLLAACRKEKTLWAFASPEEDRLTRSLSSANLWLTLISISSGLGVLIAIFYPEIRCYMRSTIYIQLFSMIIFGFVAQSIVRRYWPARQDVIGWTICGFLLAFGLFDQTASKYSFSNGDYPLNRPAVAQKTARYQADADYFHQVEQALPAGTMVFELPYVSFWTFNGMVGNIEYEHLIPFLQTKHLKFTYGSIVGTAVDLWQRRVAQRPVADFLREISALGFRAVLVDREGYADKAAVLVAQLREQIHTDPITSPNDRYLVFKLSDPGFVLEVDPYTYRPNRLTVTDLHLFKPDALPDYILGDKLSALIKARPEADITLTGTDLKSVIDEEMFENVSQPPTQSTAVPQDAFKGGVSCAAEAVINVDPAGKKLFYTVPINVANDSTRWWNFDNDRSNAWTIRGHLLDEKKQMQQFDFPFRQTIAASIRPHTARSFLAVIDASMIAPIKGTHYLQLNILQDGVSWLPESAERKPCLIKIVNNG